MKAKYQLSSDIQNVKDASSADLCYKKILNEVFAGKENEMWKQRSIQRKKEHQNLHGSMNMYLIVYKT